MAVQNPSLTMLGRDEAHDRSEMVKFSLIEYYLDGKLSLH